jgi:DNA-binding transcriptional regulator LsrR (DeoR family)
MQRQRPGFAGAGRESGERDLEGVHGLDQAIGVPTPNDEQKIACINGVGIVLSLGDQLHNRETIGADWGRKCLAAFRAIPHHPWRRQTIEAPFGRLTRTKPAGPFEFAARFTRVPGVSSQYDAASIHAGDKITRHSLKSPPVERDKVATIHAARALTLAVTMVTD